MIRCVRVAAACAGVMAGAFSLTGHAGQARSVADRVYTAGQAARGQQIYKARCAECHGSAMEGTAGPPLLGPRFLANWSARPLVGLADKIQETMPFNLVTDLSRQESTDLVAAILAAGGYPAGPAELNAQGLSDTAFPQAAPVAAAAATAARPSALPPPEGSLAELMRAIAFPNSNVIFNLQVKDPGAQPKKKVAAVPFDYVEWGATVYPGWLAVDQAAIALTETAALLLTPGRLCQNGRPVPVDRADWKQYVADLVDAGKLAHKASQARNFEAFIDISDKLNNACANCHKAYRDKGGTEGSGATRCQ